MTTRHLHNESRGYEPRPAGDDTGRAASQQRGAAARRRQPTCPLPGKRKRV